MKLQMIALSMALALAAAPAVAQDKTKDSMMKPPTMQECKDMMSMKSDGMKKDEATTKKMAACDEMMKKGDAMKGDAMAPKK